VDCGSASYRGVLALAALTFCALTAGFPLACGWLSAQHERERGQATRFLVGPLRAMEAGWRAAWVTLVRFGRKLLLPLVVASASYDDQSLPVVVFLSLLALLLLQVLVKPYRLERDNVLELVLLVVLMLGYFESVSAGASAASGRRGQSVDLVPKALVLVYWAWRVVLPRVVEWRSTSRGCVSASACGHGREVELEEVTPAGSMLQLDGGKRASSRDSLEQPLLDASS
jgi:hypothetical protein